MGTMKTSPLCSGTETLGRHRDGGIDLAQWSKPHRTRHIPNVRKTPPANKAHLAVRFLGLRLNLIGSLEDLMPSLMTGLPGLIIAAVLGGIRTPQNT